MKKIFIIIALGLFFSTNLLAQACHCPEGFQVTDSLCTRINVIKNGQGFLVFDTIRACKGSTVTYKINSSLNGCSFPGITYTYVVSNGTLISNVGGQFTIQWGNSSLGSVTVNYSYSAGGAGGLCTGSFTIIALLTPNPGLNYPIVW